MLTLCAARLDPLRRGGESLNINSYCALGSILGPLISNVYLHRFDVWLRDQGDCWHDPTVSEFHNSRNKRANMLRTNLKLGIHVRYADDILVLCKTREHAERFRHSVTNYLARNMKLEINCPATL